MTQAAEDDPFGFGTPTVRLHLEMLQGVIQRMAENSRSCKLWSSTALSVVLFLSVRFGVPGYALVALVPLSLFSLLDIYYLSLEQRFRSSYNDTLEALKGGSYGPDNAYRIAPAKFRKCYLAKCLQSPSIWIYYGAALCVVVAVWAIQNALMTGPD